jgi:hypothetical protein
MIRPVYGRCGIVEAPGRGKWNQVNAQVGGDVFQVSIHGFYNLCSCGPDDICASRTGGNKKIYLRVVGNPSLDLRGDKRAFFALAAHNARVLQKLKLPPGASWIDAEMPVDVQRVWGRYDFLTAPNGQHWVEPLTVNMLGVLSGLFLA